MTNFQRTYSIGEVEVEGSAIYHATEYRERRDHYTLFGCTREIARLRHVARRLRRRAQRAARGGGAVRGRAHGERRARLEPDRLASARPAPRARRRGDLRVRARLRRAGRRAEVRAARRRRQGAAAARCSRGTQSRARSTRPSTRCARAGTTCSPRFQVECPDPHAQRMLNTWNQYQCMATFNLSRSASFYETRDRPRHGLPRLEPGSPRLRAPRPGAGAAAHPRPRRDAARRRHVLPPVPAADEEGERRDRRRLLRRPSLAGRSRRAPT